MTRRSTTCRTCGLPHVPTRAEIVQGPDSDRVCSDCRQRRRRRRPRRDRRPNPDVTVNQLVIATWANSEHCEHSESHP